MATPVPQKDDVERWTVEQVAAWLQQVELSDCCDTFLRRGIDGHGFLQLSQEDLFQWGRDVSIRNRLQILKLVKQIKNLQQHPCTTRQSIEISLDLGSQPLKPYNDNAVDSDVKGFSCCEEETEEYAGQEASPTPPIPMRSADMATCSSFPRTNTGQNNILHGPGSRSLETHSDNNLNDCEDSSFDEEEIEEHSGQRMQPGKENAQGEECIDDLYLVPLRASPTTNHSSILNRELPTNLQRSGRLPSPSNSSSIIHQHGGMSWNQHPVKKGTPNNGRSHAPTIPERIPRRSPAPPPDTLAASHNKQPSPLHFQALTTNAAIHAPLQGANIIHGLAENGSIGVKGGLSLQRHQFPSSTLSTWQTDNESIQAHLPTQSLEKNDHVYEIVDIPQGFYGGTEAPGPNMSDQQSPIRPPIPPPRNQNQDSDDRDLNSRQGPVSLAHSKRHAPPLPPPLVRSQLEGHNSSQARPPAPDLPIRTDRIRQPKAPPSFSGNSSHSSHKTFPQESHAPQQFSPMPTEGNLPSISLGNGECIELTPLYQMIMDKPYFQFVSRPKAKELVLQGGEGTFLIRPSTRTDKPLTLTVKHDDRSYNINIRQRPDTLFALGNEKASERTFSSIDEIVSTHYKEPITLENGECAKLKYSPSKPSNCIYVQHVAPRP